MTQLDVFYLHYQSQ